MKKMILAAFTALSLTAAIAPLAQAATANATQSSAYQGNYAGQFVGGGD